MMNGRILFLLLLLLGVGLSHLNAQKMPSDDHSLKISYTARDFNISDLTNAAWDKALDVPIYRYWSGIEAPEGRHASVRLLWSKTAIYVRFVSNQSEPFVVSEKPDSTQKTIGLWDRDVCEIFIAPDPEHANKYFEFEVAPTGEWVDLGIEVLPQARHRDDAYHSGMQSIARVERGSYTVVVRIEWRAFGRTPKAGDTWRGNLFRCVGRDPDRGYLAWQPTLTRQPSFHVPERFGQFLFVK